MRRLRGLVAKGHISNPGIGSGRWLPAAPLFVRRRYLIVVPRPSPAAPLVVHCCYLMVAPGCCPRRRSLCVAGT